ncbi:MAG TPA: DUF58 domain-containing protein, partial [Chthoniobacteraceae bacterium]
MATQAEPAGRIPFAFGRRFFFLLLLGLAWMAPAWRQPRFLLAMLAWDVLVLVLWSWDLFRMPRPAQLTVRRVWKSPLGLSQKAQITIEVENASPVPIFAKVTDETADSVRLGTHGAALTAPGRETGSASYSVEPHARGDSKFGDVWLRYNTSLRLAERWARARLSQTVRVYPNLDEGQKMRIYLIRSRQIELEKRLKRQRGHGREFESLREYRSGDEFRDISWSATARRGKLITKVHQVERSQAVWLVLDAGRLLRARVNGLTKLDYAVNAALALAQVALHS